MRHAMKALFAGAVLSTALWTGAAQAEEQFHALTGIPSEAISQTEMATVEGKLILDLSNVLGSEAVVKLLEPGQLLNVKVFGVFLGGTPSSNVGVLGMNLLGLSL